jgi:hypothetical protein
MRFEGVHLSSGHNRRVDFSASMAGSTNRISIGRHKADMKCAGKSGVHVKARLIVRMSLCAGYLRALS